MLSGEIIVRSRILESIKLKEQMLQDGQIVETIKNVADKVTHSLLNGGKVLLCGNGGSASDSLHIAGEFNGRFKRDRNAYPAVALNADVASMTAIANDYGYDSVFSRLVEGLMKPEDILIGLSTSGSSENIYQAVLKAKEIGGITVALLGRDGGKIKEAADHRVIVPCCSTARIQECHIMIGHIICELVEENMFSFCHKADGI